MARKGAGRLVAGEPLGPSSPTAATREGLAEAGPESRAERGRSPGRASLAERTFGPDAVIEDKLRDEAGRAVKRGGGSGPTPAAGRPAPKSGRGRDTATPTDLEPAVGRARAARLEVRLADAARAFRRERFGDAARILRPLASEAPSVASVRELYGLTLYRQGRWRAAAKELEAYRLVTGSADQNPVLADCYRALKRWDEVDALWTELRQASLSAELVTEGRIVTAGSYADRGDLAAGIALLEKGWRRPSRPRDHHLRRAYALADLYERAGDIARARELFGWLVGVAGDFADVEARWRSL